MKNLEFKTIGADSVKISKADDGILYFEGLAAAFGNVDSYRDMIVPGAFSDAIADFSRVRILKQHDWDDVIGKVIELKEIPEGLYIKAMISKAEPSMAIKIEEGLYSEMSIGYRTIEAEENYQTGVRILKKIELYEVSVVFGAANPKAVITASERKDEQPTDDLERKHKELKQEIAAIEAVLIERAIKAALQSPDNK